MIPKIFKKKKGIELSLTFIIGAIMAVAATFVITALILGLLGVFSSGADSGSRGSLDIVYNSVDALYSENNEESKCVIRNRFIDEDMALVGFNSDRESDANNQRQCLMGSECIREECGWTASSSNAVNKPRSCGHGPCVCLCPTSSNALGIGDLGGDDCSRDEATCLKFPVSNEVKQFYMVHDNPSRCSFSATSWSGKSLCDMVVYGETCGGSARGSDFALIVHKHLSRDSKPGIVIERLQPENVATKYPNIKTCEEVIRLSSRPQSNNEESTESEEESSPSIEVST